MTKKKDEPKVGIKLTVEEANVTRPAMMPMPTESDLFRALVREMRDAQKAYFRTRDPSWLNKSKALERDVDKQLAEPEGEPRLFP